MTTPTPDPVVSPADRRCVACGNAVASRLWALVASLPGGRTAVLCHTCYQDPALDLTAVLIAEARR